MNDKDIDIVFHVGLHKTGTTFLQKEIFGKSPDVFLTREPILHMGYKSNKVNVVSLESLSGVPHKPSVNQECRNVVIDRIYWVYPRAKIILGLRDKKSWLCSVYSQYIKTGGTKLFNDWYTNVFDKSLLDFKGYEKHIRSFFDNVLVYQYEQLNDDEKSFTKQICDFIGISIPEHENKVYNKCLSDKEIRRYRFMNKLCGLDMG